MSRCKPQEAKALPVVDLSALLYILEQGPQRCFTACAASGNGAEQAPSRGLCSVVLLPGTAAPALMHRPSLRSPAPALRCHQQSLLRQHPGTAAPSGPSCPSLVCDGLGRGYVPQEMPVGGVNSDGFQKGCG